MFEEERGETTLEPSSLENVIPKRVYWQLSLWRVAQNLVVNRPRPRQRTRQVSNGMLLFFFHRCFHFLFPLCHPFCFPPPSVLCGLSMKSQSTLFFDRSAAVRRWSKSRRRPTSGFESVPIRDEIVLLNRCLSASRPAPRRNLRQLFCCSFGCVGGRPAAKLALRTTFRRHLGRFVAGTRVPKFRVSSFLLLFHSSSFLPSLHPSLPPFPPVLLFSYFLTF